MTSLSVLGRFWFKIGSGKNKEKIANKAGQIKCREGLVCTSFWLSAITKNFQKHADFCDFVEQA